MINLIFRLLLTFNATSWVLIIYGVKEKWTLFNINPFLFGVILLIVSLVLSYATLAISLILGNDNIQACDEIESADNSQIPTYLAYFFVALSVPNLEMLIFIYLIIFIFTFLSQAQYFNPIFLIFGYHHYNVRTSNGTKIFIITTQKLRSCSGLQFEKLKRLNQSTFIELRRKHNESTNGKSKK